MHCTTYPIYLLQLDLDADFLEIILTEATLNTPKILQGVAIVPIYGQAIGELQQFLNSMHTSLFNTASVNCISLVSLRDFIYRCQDDITNEMDIGTQQFGDYSSFLLCLDNQVKANLNADLERLSTWTVQWKVSFKNIIFKLKLNFYYRSCQKLFCMPVICFYTDIHVDVGFESPFP